MLRRIIMNIVVRFASCSIHRTRHPLPLPPIVIFRNTLVWQSLSLLVGTCLCYYHPILLISGPIALALCLLLLACLRVSPSASDKSSRKLHSIQAHTLQSRDSILLLLAWVAITNTQKETMESSLFAQESSIK